MLVVLTLALWFWNHTWTTRTLSPVSAASVSLTWRHPDKRVPASHKKTKHVPAHWNTLPSLTYLPHFPVGILPLWFALISVNTEWTQWSFWTSGLLPLQSLGPVLGPRLWRQLSLSQYVIWCRRSALHQSASVNTQQNAARHFKAQLGGGGDFFNLRILFVKLLQGSWSAFKSPCVH